MSLNFLLLQSNALGESLLLDKLDADLSLALPTFEVLAVDLLETLPMKDFIQIFSSSFVIYWLPKCASDLFLD